MTNNDNCACDPGAPLNNILKQQQRDAKRWEELEHELAHQKQQYDLQEGVVQYLRSGIAAIGWIDVDDPSTLKNAAQLLPAIVKLLRHMLNATSLSEFLVQPPEFAGHDEKYIQFIEAFRRTVEDQKIELCGMESFAAKDNVEIGV